MAIAVAALVSACGDTARPPVAPVKLTLNGPTDGSRIESSTATVSGVVSPRTARVLVLGQTVSPDAGGDFSTTVALVPGTNLIDVIASTPRARPAMTALRVIRYVLVTVPDVTGQSPSSAAAAIRSAGLKPQLHGDSSPFSFLVPLPEQVCSQSPSAGDHVDPNHTVTLQVGKVCA
jgi:PASTA domain/Glucodextranase, domain B